MPVFTYISHVLRCVSVCLVSLEDFRNINIRTAIDLAYEVHRVCAVLRVIPVRVVPRLDEVLVVDICISVTLFP